MPSCIRCREPLSTPDANYCGECGFRIPEDQTEDGIRRSARHEHQGFLKIGDAAVVADGLTGQHPDPTKEYQWYLEEAVRRTFIQLGALQQWDWFNPDPISDLFFSEGLAKDEISDEAWRDVVPFCLVMEFLYEAFGIPGLRFGIMHAIAMVEDVDDIDTIEVTISWSDGQDETDEVTGPAS